MGAGCASGGSDSAPESMRAEGAKLFGAPSDAATTRAPAWRLVLASFTGDNAVQEANASLPAFRTRGKAPDAFVEARRRGAIIAIGAYDDPTSAKAQRDLKRTRAILVDGKPVYSGAFFAPPEARRAGANPEFDLATARQRFGKSIRYTLQVAVYESDNRAEAARLAEEAAATLRRDGERAFYYHGPNRSMVTIGLFTDRDYDPQDGEVSPKIKELLARHPRHLYNGMGVRERGPDGETRDQPPRLVRVP